MDQPPQNELAALSGRHWVRCSAYVIEGGMIRPAPGATLEIYDPWQADREARSEEERPFKVLLRLAQRMEAGAELPKRQRQELERWVAANGLLGILPHQTLEYHAWPRWRASPEHDRDYIWASQRIVSRTAGGWRTRWVGAGPQRPVGAEKLGAAVDEELISESARPVETIMRTWPDGEIERAALGRKWSSFFPDLGPYEAVRHNYPSFESEEFWLTYSEPLRFFLRWPRRLADALSIFQPEAPGGQDWRTGRRDLALAEINDAAFPTSLRGGRGTGDEIELGWSSPSLFGCYAVMLLEALGAGQRAMTCPVCGGLFLSKAYQARFCSSICRATHHKREWRRARSEEAAEQVAENEDGAQ